MQNRTPGRPRRIVPALCLALSVSLVLLFVTCTGTSSSGSRVHTAYFVNPTTVGVLVSFYRGGDGLPGSADEHPHDFYQKVFLYDISAATLTDQGTIASLQPYGGWDAAAAESILVLDIGISGRSAFPYYSLQGVLRGTVTPSSSLSGPYLEAVSPNGRYLLFRSLLEQHRQVYDMSTKTSGPVCSIPTGTGTVYRLENDGAHCVIPMYGSNITVLEGLGRLALSDGTIDTLARAHGYYQVYRSQPTRLMFKDTIGGTVGFFAVDTAASPMARYVSLGIAADPIDVDTTSGGYLTIAGEAAVMLGNYKTGTAAKQIYP
jgi:hypothetical protein